jgi:RimJ/RimL family protein N-acetyltransferase
MSWIAQEPLSLDHRREMLEEWERDWLRGGDVALGTFVSGRVAGSCGLHGRIGPGGLEIGYWTHPSFLRRGIATTAAGLLTGAGFAVPGITHVEIHHDKANKASAGVPRKLGYRLVDEVRDEREAPAEVGIECRWRLARQDWSYAAAPVRTTRSLSGFSPMRQRSG